MPDTGGQMACPLRMVAGVAAANTGGGAAFIVAGLEVYYRRIVLGGSWHGPIAQMLAQGSIQAHARGMVHLGLIL